MQIQLKQPEIEAALKMFIAQQGINLAGKTVAIEFTSGRKNNGLTADLVIEEQGIKPDSTVNVLQPSDATPAATDPANPAVAGDEGAVVKPTSLFK